MGWLEKSPSLRCGRAYVFRSGTSFARGIELHTQIGLKAKDLEFFFERFFWPVCLQSQCSFVIRDLTLSGKPSSTSDKSTSTSDTDSVVAAGLGYECSAFEKYAQMNGEKLEQTIAECSPQMQIVAQLLESTDRDFHEYLLKQQTLTSERIVEHQQPSQSENEGASLEAGWMEVNAICIDWQIVERENSLALGLFQVAEEEFLRRAQLFGFVGLKTLNANPVTVVLITQSFHCSLYSLSVYCLLFNFTYSHAFA